MRKLRFVYIFFTLSLCSGVLYANTQDRGRVALREMVRQQEEKFIESVLGIYTNAVANGDKNSSVVLDHFYSESFVSGFSARSLLNVLSHAKVESIIEQSQLPNYEVACDLISVLYTFDQHIEFVITSIQDDDTPLFYEKAGVPMTVLGEVNWHVINEMDADEKALVVLLVKEVDQNRATLMEKNALKAMRPRIRKLAQRLYMKNLIFTKKEKVSKYIVVRTKADYPSVLEWVTVLASE
jgi:hypothetical protein